jgi:hypothetical protein
VLTKAVAAVHLGAVHRRSIADVPVMFFGTNEIAWVAPRDAVPWAEGMGQQLHAKGKKHKQFATALEQVRRRRRGPGGAHSSAGAVLLTLRRRAAPHLVLLCPLTRARPPQRCAPS